MKKHNLLLALGAALLLAPLACTTAQGQTWETVDQDGQPDEIYVDGQGYSRGGGFWTVRRSRDGGATRTTTEYFPGVAEGVAGDRAGNVYVTGGSASGIATRKLAAPAQ